MAEGGVWSWGQSLPGVARLSVPRYVRLNGVVDRSNQAAGSQGSAVSFALVRQMAYREALRRRGKQTRGKTEADAPEGYSSASFKVRLPVDQGAFGRKS